MRPETYTIKHYRFVICGKFTNSIVSLLLLSVTSSCYRRTQYLFVKSGHYESVMFYITESWGPFILGHNVKVERDGQSL